VRAASLPFLNRRDPFLLGLAWKEDWNRIEFVFCDVLHRRAMDLCDIWLSALAAT